MNGTSIILLSEPKQLAALQKTNEYSTKFGLSLSEKDMHTLVEQRREALSKTNRVEFGPGVLDKLIFAFCDSAYIWQSNYVETISRLQEIFYHFKNECVDRLSDDELIAIMRDAFENECHGALEYLEETALYRVSRKVRLEKYGMKPDDENEETDIRKGADWNDEDDDDD